MRGRTRGKRSGSPGIRLLAQGCSPPSAYSKGAELERQLLGQPDQGMLGGAIWVQTR